MSRVKAAYIHLQLWSHYSKRVARGSQPCGILVSPETYAEKVPHGAVLNSSSASTHLSL